MAQTDNATPTRVAIRAALHAAGIITAEGQITGHMLDTPDAAVFALIERKASAKGLYDALWRQLHEAAAGKAEMTLEYEAWQQARRQLADTPAVTVEGARAKAAAALADTNPGRGGGGCMAGTSATREAPAAAGEVLTQQKAAFVYLYRHLRPEGQRAFHAFLVETDGVSEGLPMRDAYRRLCIGLGMPEERASAEADRVCGGEDRPVAPRLHLGADLKPAVHHR